MLVNDIHSQLNPTRVARVLKPSGLTALVDVVRAAAAAGAQLSICGGRHAMGGQQYGTDTWLVDMCDHAAVHSLDEKTGVLVADAGILWPDLIQGCAMLHPPGSQAWGIRQKQTGADRLTLGGALSANVHGRGLRLPPIIADVEAFTLVDPNAEVRRCSRTENVELFRLVMAATDYLALSLMFRFDLCRG